MVNLWIFQNFRDEHYERETDKWSYYKANKKWLFYRDSPNVQKVKPGDKVLLRFFDEGFKGKIVITSPWVEDSSIDPVAYKGNFGWIAFNNVELWEPSLPTELVMEQLSNKQYRHAIIKITEKDFNIVESCQKLYRKLGLGSKHSDDIVVLEKGIEYALKENLSSLGLKLVKGGQQSPMGSGRCDLLCMDANENYVVIEIKREKETGDEVVGQCLRYIGFVKSTMLKAQQNVSGLIITGGYNDDISWAIKALPEGLITKKIFRLPL